MSTVMLPDLQQYTDEYRSLEAKLEALGGDDPATLLVTFPQAEMDEEYTPKGQRIVCQFDELTAYCPWTKFPDQGTIVIEYSPDGTLLELKSYKYYLLAFRDRHITQEHLAQKVYADLLEKLEPNDLRVVLDYMPRGGIHTTYELSTRTLE